MPSSSEPGALGGLGNEADDHAISSLFTEADIRSPSAFGTSKEILRLFGTFE